MITRRRKVSKRLVVAIILVQLILLAVRGCAGRPVNTQGIVCKPAYDPITDDDSQDMGYIIYPEDKEPCPWK